MKTKEEMDRDWNTCRHCGIVDGQEKYNYVIMGCCRNCRIKIDNKIDFDSAQQDGYIRRDSSIMCPHCGYVISVDAWEYDEHSEFDCPNCDKKSSLSVEYTTHYTTTKIP